MITPGQIMAGSPRPDAAPTDAGASAVNPAQLSVDTAQAVIDMFASRLAKAEAKLEWKVDRDGVVASILMTNEDVLIKGSQVGLVGEVTFVDWVRDMAGNPTPGLQIDPAITRIIGDRIQTGKVASNTWSTTAGSLLDLDAGTLTLGGSASPKFLVDATGHLTCTGATVTGTLTAGSIIDASATVSGTTLGTINSDAQAGYNHSLTPHAPTNADNTAQILGNSATAITLTSSNLFQTAASGARVLIGAGGVVGYNSSGVASFTLNAATGYLTCTGASVGGTLVAGSVIDASATVSGTTLGTINSDAAAGYNHSLTPHAPSTADNTAQILGASATAITMTSSNLFQTAASGARVLIGAGGIIGYDSSGATTFSLNATTGAATFAGDVNTTGHVVATGSWVDTPSGLSAAVIGASADNSLGVLGRALIGVAGLSGTAGGTGVEGNATGASSYGVAGYAPGDNSVAVYGMSQAANGGIGVYGSAPTGTGIGVKAASAGTALVVLGKMTIDNATLVTNLNADQLDGLHSTAFLHATGGNVYTFPGGTLTSSTGVASFSGFTPTANAATNVWVKMVIDSTTCYIPVWVC